jgi:hypothetical protein
VSGNFLSRSEVTIGTVLYYRQFQGHTDTKDRYFIVVAMDETHFYCLTTTTSVNFIGNPRFASERTPPIPLGSECFRRECVVDCTELHSLDDILISNYLNSKRVTIDGTISTVTARCILNTSTSNSCRLLSPRDKKRISEGLGALCRDETV